MLQDEVELARSPNICRVCSSKGDYDIFSVIPAYLHAGANEFLHWKKDISTLLEETTGLTVDPSDGLPKKMCALCISYLKHAATFRQQAIDNTINLKAAQMLASTGGSKAQKKCQKNSIINANPDKQKVCVSADDLIFSETRKTDTTSLVNNFLNNHHKGDDYNKKFLLADEVVQQNKDNRTRNDEREKNNLKTYLNLLFEKGVNKVPSRSVRKRYHRWNSAEGFEANNGMAERNTENSESMGEELQTASSDDNEIHKGGMHYFNYKEKNFEEDDITQLEVFKEANIIINIPEYCEERKCRACFRRFMFEDSFQEHKKICIEYRLLIFIEEANRLLDIRRNKAVSPHEFIRRMIFCLKKICEWVNVNYGDSIKLPDLVIGENGERKKTKSEGSHADNEDIDGKMSQNIKEIVEKNFKELKCESSTPPSTSSEKNENCKDDNPLLELLRSKADSSMLRYEAKTPDPLLELLKLKESPIPLTKPKLDSISSESSYTCSIVEQNLRINNEFSKPPKIENGRKSLLESFNKVAASSPIIARPIPINTNPTVSPMLSPAYPKLPFSARCNACDTIFETIASLEDHNAKFHNNPDKLEKHKQIIALFEGEDGPNNLEGSVDVINILNCDPLRNNSVESSRKMAKCSTCDRKFATIIHLDQHKTQCHVNTNKLVV